MPAFPWGLGRIPSSTGGKLGLKQGGRGGPLGRFSSFRQLQAEFALKSLSRSHPIPTLLLSPLFLSAWMYVLEPVEARGQPYVVIP